jgi:hypothetical protein
MPEPLDAEDAKLVTLARAARARVGATEGAAVRDSDGRTHAAATVDLPSLSLTALRRGANAVSAGATAPEAAAVVINCPLWKIRRRRGSGARSGCSGLRRHPDGAPGHPVTARPTPSAAGSSISRPAQRRQVDLTNA